MDVATKQQLAAEAWRQMFGFLIATREHREKVLRKYDLTPGDSKALVALSATQGQPMSALSGAWTCDPSNATYMIDRLETRGLAERRINPEDRRQKLVVLTAEGERVKRNLRKDLDIPPPELLSLSGAELLALRNALSVLPVSEY